MNEILERRLSRLRRRLCWAAYCGELSRHLGVALLAVGVVVLLLRFLGDLSRQQALWCLLLLTPTLWTAWWQARRRFVGRSTVASWLDVQSGASGTLVTQFEVADAAWETQAIGRLLQRRIAAPRLRLRHYLGPTLPAALFASAVFYFDVDRTLASLTSRIHETAVQRVAEKLQALEETVELEPDLRAELEDRLGRIEEEVSVARPESTFEALDTMEQQLGELAESIQETMQETEAGLQSESFEESLAAQDPQALETLKNAWEELQDAGLDLGLPESLAKLMEGLEGLQGMELPPGQWPEASAELLEFLEGKLGQLVAAGLLKPGQLKAGQMQFLEHECDEDCKKDGG